MNKTKKVASRLSLIVLGLVLAGLAFIYFSPGYNLYLVRSESMEPAINMGDLIITGPLDGPINGEIRPGTVVTYEYKKELVTHRVKSIEGAALVTQGDAVESRIQTLGRLRCPVSKVFTCSRFPTWVT
jgi:signal peptidase I